MNLIPLPNFSGLGFNPFLKSRNSESPCSSHSPSNSGNLRLGHKLLRFSNYNVHFNINDYI